MGIAKSRKCDVSNQATATTAAKLNTKSKVSFPTGVPSAMLYYYYYYYYRQLDINWY